MRANNVRSEAQTRAYVGAQPPSARQGLRLLAAAIRDAVPDAEAVFTYGIPGFRVDGKPLAWYAAWAEHWSMYPITPAMRTAGGAELAKYASGKGTVRFDFTGKLPVRLIKRLVKARAAEIRAAGKRRTPTAAKRAGGKQVGKGKARRHTKALS